MRCVVLGLFVLGACGGESADLRVDLRSDWVPGAEIASVSVELAGRPAVARPLFADALLIEGVEIARFDGLTLGQHDLLVRLHAPSGAVHASHASSVEVQGDLGITVVMTRDCSGVTCPSGFSCWGGVCTDETCVLGDSINCPEPECVLDQDCPTQTSCAPGRCVDGICYAVADHDSCEGGVCNPDSGCLPEVPDDGPCTDAQTRSCFSGDPSRIGVGLCREGSQMCASGSWSACEGEIISSSEECGNDADDDCDSLIDEDCGACSPGQTRSCYDGPAGTRGIGSCADGIQVCLDGAWSGACEGATHPGTEDCSNGLDDDCSGQPDDAESCISTCNVVDSVVECSTAGPHTLMVPAGVTSLEVAAWGGGGGGATGTGGGGAFAGGTLEVSGGELLTIEVARGGAPLGGGGGATAIYSGATVLLVAGGGGGAAAAGSPDEPFDSNGGAAGTDEGQGGFTFYFPPYGMARGGLGGTQSAGGEGGRLEMAMSGTTCFSDGAPGASLLGGAAGGGGESCSQGPRGARGWEGGTNGYGNGHGGSGGAGYFGGGGGAGRTGYGGGGGGGGSSYVDPDRFGGVTMTAATGPMAGNTSHPDYQSGVGEGGGRSPVTGGGRGRVVLRW